MKTYTSLTLSNIDIITHLSNRLYNMYKQVNKTENQILKNILDKLISIDISKPNWQESYAHLFKKTNITTIKEELPILQNIRQEGMGYFFGEKSETTTTLQKLTMIDSSKEWKSTLKDINQIIYLATILCKMYESYIDLNNHINDRLNSLN